ncbi:condensin complex subunit 2-like [Musca vetustissima]|uniref:condensin complex subunit 2-like n=1 Tax=Musca vetustissima TaxID=27455 RepID=UPI002AB67459|nr:condensin complex subunit 2-like [Musca vetustissima]
MTPAHTDSPLRRSEAGVLRDGQAHNVTINDDEEERRQARRRTLLSSTGGSDAACLEENETLKKCLEIYNGNKLSKDNAWSVSLIDTLSTLLDRHHKSLNNFKVAGSSLEASSKVYSLRVDSIHTDVLRMSAGLNAQKFNEKQLQNDDDDEDDVATGGEGGNDPNASAAGVEGAEKQPAQKKQKKKRNLVSTITKNKDTINARLDTVPLQDPVFGKLNSIVGSINSSNRLMNNILLTTESELRLRTTFAIWDSKSLPVCDYTEEVPLSTENEADLASCDRLFKISNVNDMELRPMHGGYVISDTPESPNDDKDNDTRRMSVDSDCDDGPPGCSDGGGGGSDDIFAPFQNVNELGMAFDMNAECEPVPALSEHVPIMDVNYEELDDDLTVEERTAINNCRGLRKEPVLIEDLRPVDASSKLEYSYRPLDKISQFWAGPSHWKFKRTRPNRQTLSSQQQHLSSEGVAGRLNQRAKRNKIALEKKKSKQLTFGEFHDELFIKLDDKYKSRKANIQKKWDQRKLKLPVDLQLDPLRFFTYKYAPGLTLHMKHDERDSTAATTLTGGTEDDDTLRPDDHHFNDGGDDMPHFNDDGMAGCGGDEGGDGAGMNTSHTSTHHNDPQAAEGGMGDDAGNMENLNETVLEIAHEYEGAPSQVTKIVVPFAKRAKVIDMKNLKRSCSLLLTKQFKQPVKEEEVPKHPIPKKEKYQDGMGSFHEIYEHLPEILPKAMAESLSTSIAFYSVLHLANEFDLRLIPEEDLKDFKIRKVTG